MLPREERELSEEEDQAKLDILKQRIAIMAARSSELSQSIDRISENNPPGDDQCTDLNSRLLHFLVDLPNALRKSPSDREVEDLIKRGADLVKELLVKPIKPVARCENCRERSDQSERVSDVEVPGQCSTGSAHEEKEPYFPKTNEVEMPKRATTAYINFTQFYRERIKKTGRTVPKIGEFGKECESKWNAMNDYEKNLFTKEAENDHERWFFCSSETLFR